MNDRRRRLALPIAAVVAAGLGLLLLSSWLEEDRLRTDLASAVRRVREGRAAAGEGAVRATEQGSGRAAQGERVVVPLGGLGPGEIVVVGVCDGDCSSLGLRLLARDGRVVGQDGWGDAVPVVAALVERGDMLSLEIDLRRCDARECRFAWQALALEGEGSEDAATTTGTCFAVSPDGLVLTAQHVVEGAARIEVRFVGGTPLLAKVEKVDAETDVALLRVSGPTPEYLNLADDGAVRLGEPVFTVGFPAVDVLGEEPKYSEGSVGALAGLEGAPPSLQLSIAVQPGSSGGPVVNDHGEVVGIVESVADAAFFRGADGLVPQPLSWAVQAGAVRDLVPEVDAPTPTESRAEAVQRVLGAVCLVEAR